MNRLYKNKLTAFYLSFWIFSSFTFAQDEFISEFANEFKTEQGNLFYLSVQTEFGIEDNFLFSDEDEQETTFLRLSPAMMMQAQFGRQLFSVSANSHHWQFKRFDDDKYSDFLFSPRYRFKFEDNKTFFADASIKNSYQRRGTGLSIGNGESLNKGDELEVIAFSGGYLFGQQASVAKIKAEIGFKSAEFLTRRYLTDVFDKQNNFIDFSFDYLLSGKSYFSSSFKYEDIEFENNPIFGNDRYIGLAGVKWNTTEITRLELLVGYQKVNFDEPTFADDSSFKWRLNGEWSPFNSTQVLFHSESTFEEANRLQSRYGLVDLHKIKATFQYSDVLNLLGEFSYRNEQIFYTQRTEKNDYSLAKLQINYEKSDWLSFFIKYEYDGLDSSSSLYNHQKNSISLGFNASI